MSAGAFVFVAAAAAIMLASFVYVRKAAAGQRARAGTPLCPTLPLPSLVVSGCAFLSVWTVSCVTRLEIAAKAAEQELLNMVKTLLVRLGRTYDDGTRRSLMVEPMVRIQFKGVGMVLNGSNRWLLENVSGVYNPGAHVSTCVVSDIPSASVRRHIPHFLLVFSERVLDRGSARPWHNERNLTSRHIVPDAGHLHAIMGPSGCGKTSLLTALSGKALNGRLQGSIRYNGETMAPQQVCQHAPCIACTTACLVDVWTSASSSSLRGMDVVM